MARQLRPFDPGQQREDRHDDQRERQPGRDQEDRAPPEARGPLVPAGGHWPKPAAR